MILDSSNDIIDMICCTNDAAVFGPEETMLVDELFEGSEHNEAELLDGSMQDVENAQSYCKYSERQDDEATFIDEENTSSSAVSLGIDQSKDKTLILQSSEDVEELVVIDLYSMLYVSVCFYSSPFTL